MSRAAVELDFFGLEKANAASSPASSSKSQFQKFLHRQRSFRDIQGSISKIDPELVKTVIASGYTNQYQKQSASTASSGNENQTSSVSVPSSPKDLIQNLFPALPVYSPAPWPAVSETSGTTPLTIFYNGVVTVYDVPRDKAESILRLAVEGRGATADSADPKVAPPSADRKHLLETLNSGDLPIFRKKSLQRFMEKRRERITSASPYAYPN